MHLFHIPRRCARMREEHDLLTPRRRSWKIERSQTFYLFIIPDSSGLKAQASLIFVGIELLSMVKETPFASPRFHEVEKTRTHLNPHTEPFIPSRTAHPGEEGTLRIVDARPLIGDHRHENSMVSSLG